MSNTFKEDLRVPSDYQLQREKAYEIYLRHTTEFKSLFLDYLIAEHQALKKAFPNVSFFSRARIKSPRSYMDKVEKSLSQGHQIQIYDILAEKHVIESVDGNTDEQACISACYNFLDFIRSFNQEHSYEEVFGRYKDYIESPKENGYQSLHISCNHRSFSDYHKETQIRTYEMEQLAKTGEASHSQNYKKRVLDDQLYRSVPLYIVINDILSPPVMEMPFKECFKYYYGISYDDYILEKNKEIII